ncbi:carboxypeptidase-like regulatory domain-containing protein [Fulvivirga lutea]|uniref:Carboxypeptidase-like regulatory domain-containing protein n=1 Tax=Fulvivirga lutea TaxID=2810512 RepID=A0A975A0J8_9BACT|nr:carboxypeptidase-like regulatory domain-containing protein [Fulvivirga lutea]QSE96507.1 carboxypeptidase-like regulatory domain-containing protein [Fulvivirga lutea]
MRIFFTFILLIICFKAHAQDLINGRRSSPFTYIYQITNEEAEAIHKKSISVVGDIFFHSLVDSVHTDSVKNKAREVGHYLYVVALGNQLNIDYRSVDNLEIRIINNEQDFQVVLLDEFGENIDNASLHVDNKNIKYNQSRNTYYQHKSNLDGLLKANYNGHTTFLPIGRSRNNKLAARIYRKIKYKSPIKYLWKPFVDIYRSVRWGYPTGFIGTIVSWFNSDNSEQKYGGYIALNKPKYKPGDTVKFKAYIIKKNYNGFNKPLTLTVGNYANKFKNLGKIKPTRRGVYIHEFVLHDTLDFDLDRYQYINLEKKKYHTVISEGFDYEDYELNTAYFNLKSKHKSHFSSEPLELILTAKDDNDLNLPDARVELIITFNRLNSFEQNQVFVNDTLFTHKFKLDPLGDTYFTLPDSIFPAANIGYKVNAKFFTSDNEWSIKELDLEYKSKSSEVKFELKNDSINFKYIKDNQSYSQNAKLIVRSGANDILTKSIILPYSEKILPIASSYHIETSEGIYSFPIYNEDDGVHINWNRTNDSLFIKLNNERSLPFWYTIFAGKKEVLSGLLEDKSKELRISTTTKKPYFISYQYLWGGNVEENQMEAPYYDKNLNILSNEPLVINPGSSVSIDILVKDQNGEPVPNIDLTAYSYKKSMNKHGSTPEVPYMGKIYSGRSMFNSFRETFGNRLSENRYLDYSNLYKELGLDSIAYYHFLYPDSIYTYSFPITTGTTEFAPFVVDEKGNIQKIYIIYVDEYPVYFSSALNANYSFHISPNVEHDIKLRLADKEISFGNISFKEGFKTIFSLMDKDSPTVKIESKERRLSQNEQNTLANYFILINDNFKNQFAYLKQYERVELISKNQPSYYRRNNPLLSGPWRSDSAKLTVLNDFSSGFIVEPGNEYLFSNDLIKLKEIRSNYFDRWLNQIHWNYRNFEELALSEADIKSSWQEYLIESERKSDKYETPQETQNGHGRLNIQLSDSVRFLSLFTDRVILKGVTDPNQLRVYNPSVKNIEDLPPGSYSLLYLLEDDKYFEQEVHEIKENGTLFINISDANILPFDSMIDSISSILKKNVGQTNYIKGELDKNIRVIKELVNNQPNRYSSFDNKLSGRITSMEDGSGLPGVNVVVKGTRIGTVTDIDGYYTLYAPKGSELVFSFIGLATEEIEVGNRRFIDVQMSPDVQQLSEVVVTAVGVRRESKALGYSVTALQGKAPGVAAGASDNIIIRGNTSIVGNSKALIIIDGVPYSGKQSDLDPNSIQSIETLSSEDGVALYGSRASNGVILIKTKAPGSKGINAPEQDINATSVSQANSIRSNFSDYAYWKPDLLTDQDGKATFEVTYPDDITNWKTIILGMGNKRFSGKYEGSVKSVKSVSTLLSLPDFIVEGDTTMAIGKITNYTMDTLGVNYDFLVNGSNVKTHTSKLQRSLIDSIRLTSDTNDSLMVTFKMKSLNGNYFDGEARAIEIKKKGSELAKGYFFQIKKDSTYHLTFDNNLGDVKLKFLKSTSDIIQEEAVSLSSYIYDCNEQMASKLKGLLYLKKITEANVQSFKKEREVKKLIKKLESNQNESGMWGWWGNSQSEDWITKHVLSALIIAKQNGYSVSYKSEAITSKIKWNLEDYEPTDKLWALNTLYLLGENIDYESHLNRFNIDSLGLHDQISYYQLKKDLQLDLKLDTLINRHKETYLGNIYWDDNNSKVYNNGFVNTVRMIKLLSNIDTLSDLRNGAINYLFEKRSLGKWKNTYESAQVIETLSKITESIVGENSSPSLVVNGKRVDDLEIERTIKNDSLLSLSTSSNLPVYISAYQKKWIQNPAINDRNIKVSSYFDGKDYVIKSGEEVSLIVDLNIKNEVDFLMIEVPIPAGFSYSNKYSKHFNETHREYYKEKTNIYVRTLKPGKHQYEIKLMPRYKGTYTMNPVKVESMYFPAFNGNNKIERVIIN